MKTKFRAWDNVKDCMYYLGEDENVVFAFFSSGIIATDITEGEDEFSVLHHLQYMQYTGLNDSEGTEIYEGDIVKVTHAEYFIDKICTVVWGLDNNDHYPAFHMPELDTESNSFSEVFNVDGYFVKVIGNIHENKYLLEEK